MKKSVLMVLGVLLCVSTTLGFAKPLSQESLEQDFSFIRDNIGGDALLLEATLYEFGSQEQGIEPDPLRSIKLYGMLFNSKNPIAAYKLGMLAWRYQTNPTSLSEEMVAALEKIYGLEPAEYFASGSAWGEEIRYKEIADINTIMYGITLFAQDRFEESIKALNSKKDIANRSLSQLYTAFNYLKLKNEKLANIYLNKACHNPQIEDNVMEFCINSDGLEKVAFEE